MERILSTYDLKTISHDLDTARDEHNHRTAMMYLRFIAASGAFIIAGLMALIVVLATR